MTGHDPLCHAAAFKYHDPECCDCDLIAKVRAAERDRIRARTSDALSGLRAKVESLAGVHGIWLYRDDVLALIDGDTP